MNIDDAFPSEYLAAHDLDKESTYTLEMDRVEMRELTNRQQQTEEKPVLFFRGAKKALVLNRTNAQTIAETYGSQTDDWRGRRVTLYVARERAFGELTDCLRVRIPADLVNQVEQMQADLAADTKPEQPAQQQTLPGTPQRPTTAGYHGDDDGDAPF